MERSAEDLWCAYYKWRNLPSVEKDDRSYHTYLVPWGILRWLKVRPCSADMFKTLNVVCIHYSISRFCLRKVIWEEKLLTQKKRIWLISVVHLMWDLFKVAFTVQCILISLNFVWYYYYYYLHSSIHKNRCCTCFSHIFLSNVRYRF